MPTRKSPKAWTVAELNRIGEELAAQAAAKYAADPDEPEMLAIVRVTLRMARAWLERNIERNRSKRPRDIENLSRDMGADEPHFLCTGDTIKLTPFGELIDGQQRLEAFVKAAKENPRVTWFRTGVAFNIAEEAILVTDTGARRTFRDWLKLKDQQYQTNVSAIVRRFFEWELGNYVDLRGWGAMHGGFIQPTESELATFWEPRREEFDAAVRIAQDARQHSRANTTATGTAYIVLRRIDDAQCKAFFEHLVVGEHLGRYDPIKKLRDRLMLGGDPRAEKADKLNATEQLYLMFQAWNIWREDGTVGTGQPVKALVLPPRTGRKKGITNDNFIQPV